MRHNVARRGFSLLTTIVAIAILAILSIVIVSRVTGQVKKTSGTSNSIDASVYTSAVKQYYSAPVKDMANYPRLSKAEYTLFKAKAGKHIYPGYGQMNVTGSTETVFRNIRNEACLAIKAYSNNTVTQSEKDGVTDYYLVSPHASDEAYIYYYLSGVVKRVNISNLKYDAVNANTTELGGNSYWVYLSKPLPGKASGNGIVENGAKHGDLYIDVMKYGSYEPLSNYSLTIKNVATGAVAKVLDNVGSSAVKVDGLGQGEYEIDVSKGGYWSYPDDSSYNTAYFTEINMPRTVTVANDGYIGDSASRMYTVCLKQGVDVTASLNTKTASWNDSSNTFTYETASVKTGVYKFIFTPHKSDVSVAPIVYTVGTSDGVSPIMFNSRTSMTNGNGVLMPGLYDLKITSESCADQSLLVNVERTRMTCTGIENCASDDGNEVLPITLYDKTLSISGTIGKESDYQPVSGIPASLDTSFLSPKTCAAATISTNVVAKDSVTGIEYRTVVNSQGQYTLGGITAGGTGSIDIHIYNQYGTVMSTSIMAHDGICYTLNADDTVDKKVSARPKFTVSQMNGIKVSNVTITLQRLGDSDTHVGVTGEYGTSNYGVVTFLTRGKGELTATHPIPTGYYTVNAHYDVNKAVVFNYNYNVFLTSGKCDITLGVDATTHSVSANIYAPDISKQCISNTNVYLKNSSNEIIASTVLAASALTDKQTIPVCFKDVAPGQYKIVVTSPCTKEVSSTPFLMTMQDGHDLVISERLQMVYLPLSEHHGGARSGFEYKDTCGNKSLYHKVTCKYCGESYDPLNKANETISADCGKDTGLLRLIEHHFESESGFACTSESHCVDCGYVAHAPLGHNFTYVDDTGKNVYTPNGVQTGKHACYCAYCHKTAEELGVNVEHSETSHGLGSWGQITPSLVAHINALKSEAGVFTSEECRAYGVSENTNSTILNLADSLISTKCIRVCKDIYTAVQGNGVVKKIPCSYYELKNHEPCLKYDEAYHWKQCKDCGYMLTSKEAHVPVYKDNDCTKDKICSICGKVLSAGLQSHNLSPTGWTPCDSNGDTSKPCGYHCQKCMNDGCNVRVIRHCNSEYVCKEVPDSPVYVETNESGVVVRHNVDKNMHTVRCKVCGYAHEEPHEWVLVRQGEADSEYHVYRCICGAMKRELHEYVSTAATVSAAQEFSKETDGKTAAQMGYVDGTDGTVLVKAPNHHISTLTSDIKTFKYSSDKVDGVRPNVNTDSASILENPASLYTNTKVIGGHTLHCSICGASCAESHGRGDYFTIKHVIMKNKDGKYRLYSYRGYYCSYDYKKKQFKCDADTGLRDFVDTELAGGDNTHYALNSDGTFMLVNGKTVTVSDLVRTEIMREHPMSLSDAHSINKMLSDECDGYSPELKWMFYKDGGSGLSELHWVNSVGNCGATEDYNFSWMVLPISSQDSPVPSVDMFNTSMGIHKCKAYWYDDRNVIESNIDEFRKDIDSHSILCVQSQEKTAFNKVIACKVSTNGTKPVYFPVYDSILLQYNDTWTSCTKLKSGSAEYIPEPDSSPFIDINTGLQCKYHTIRVLDGKGLPSLNGVSATQTYDGKSVYVYTVVKMLYDTTANNGKGAWVYKELYKK